MLGIVGSLHSDTVIHNVHRNTTLNQCDRSQICYIVYLICATSANIVSCSDLLRQKRFNNLPS